MKERVDNSAAQIIHAQEGVINEVVNHLSNASKILIVNPTIQNYLRGKNAGIYQAQTAVIDEIVNIKGAFPDLEGIYIYDLNGDEIKLNDLPGMFPSKETSYEKSTIN